MKSKAAVTSALCLMATQAVSNSEHDWSGFYVGAGFMASNSDATVLEYGVGSSVPNDYFANLGENGSEVSFFLGNNFVQSSGPLLGLEAFLTTSSNDSLVNYISAGSPDPNYQVGWSEDFQIAVRTRLGMPLGGGLFFATGGLAATRGELKAYQINSTTNFETFDETMVGWTAGIGYERPLNNNWVFRADYSFTDFGDFSVRPSIANYNNLYDELVDVRQHSILLGISRYF